MAEQVLVLGVGNILFSDEAIGVRTVEHLQQCASLPGNVSFRDSMHQTDLVDTLIYCDLAGHRPDAVVIGMEPADYHTMEIGLTPVCQARLPDLAGKVVEELRARGVIA